MIDIVLDGEMDTEVRIASFMAALHCAQNTHLERIVKVISAEENTQGKKDDVLWRGLLHSS